MSKPSFPDVPNSVVDNITKTKYKVCELLGKGGFAKCFTFLNLKTREVFAGKVVPKLLIMKEHQREKMKQEIEIHRELDHKYIVKFISSFNSNEFVFIILEHCSSKSLMELHRRRRYLSEPECRYFLKQLIYGVAYLHDNQIIHRDLKLGNIFLDSKLIVKIGDFGLATKLKSDEERKHTLCGTPNYIAPEVLNKEGHGYEVDFWAIGCIHYTLLVGKPPFESNTLKDTYERIRSNQYNVPKKISSRSKNVIICLLNRNPKNRPSSKDLLAMPFFEEFTPSRLPLSCLATAPRFSVAHLIDRNPLTTSESNKGKYGDINAEKNNVCSSFSAENGDYHLSSLYQQLKKLIGKKPWNRVNKDQEEAEYPRARPIFWISKWVDYSDKYGIGYEFNDGTIGVLYNDSCNLLLYNDAMTLEYIAPSVGNKVALEQYYTTESCPAELQKKYTILKYFSSYMSLKLAKTGANVETVRDDISRVPYVRRCLRSKSAILFHLTNGSLQINIFSDHTKLILCPLMSAVTYVNKDQEFKTYGFETLDMYGMETDLATRLKYAQTLISDIFAKEKQRTAAADI